MKKIVSLTFVFLCFISATASAQDCSRNCLSDHLDNYLEAVVANSPESGGLFIGFRQTENSVVIPEGEGVWQNVTGLGSIQRVYLDPVNGSAGYFGTVNMGEEEAVVAVRMKVERDEITEAEWFISRESDPGLFGDPGETPFDLEILRDTLPAHREVSGRDRLSREALIAIVNSYFDGITSHNGNIVKGHPGCTRYENGFPTFGGPMSEGMDIGNNGLTDCRTQADFGVATVAIRDFFVVDVEAQTVMVSAMFRRDSQNTKLRNHFTELFHVDEGKIRDIHAAFYYAPADRPVPNWAPYYDGLYPLPAQY